MARERGDSSAKRSLRVELSSDDVVLLNEACRVFGVGKSELVRRLVRASVEVGPALPSEGVERIEELTGQVRIVGRNLMQVLRAIHRGEAVGVADAEPVWRGLHEMIEQLDGELAALLQGNGPSFRQAAGLELSPGVEVGAP